MRISGRAIITGTITFLIAAAIAAAACFSAINTRQKEEKRTAQYLADMSMENFAMEIDRYVQESELWKAAVVSAGGEVTRFDEIASSFADDNEVVYSVQLAPDGIVEWVWPEDTGVDGYNIIADPANIASVRIMLDTKEPYVMGPYTLWGGEKKGLIIRNPVYLENEAGRDRLWGFANIVLSLDEFLESAEVSRLTEEGYSYMIRATGTGTYDDTIADTGDVTEDDAAVHAEEAGGRTWTIYVRPSQGWFTGSALAGIIVPAVLLSVLAGIFASLCVRLAELKKQSETLQTEAAATAAELEEEKLSGRFRMDFIRRLSEEMKSPAGAINNLVIFSREDADDREMLIADLDKIDTSNRYLTSLIQNISDINELGGGSIDLVLQPYQYEDHRRYVEMILKENCNARNQSYEIVEREEEKPAVICDRARINEVILNLVRNASAYTESGGRIIYRSDLRPGDDDTILYTFSVEDNGIGMSKDFQKHMFEEFTRETDNPLRPDEMTGTGIGLYVVKALLDAMGGRIQVESSPGEGTKVFVSIPLKRADETDIHMTSAAYLRSQESQVKDCRVLLAEDNEINRQISVRIFEGLGIAADEAVNGEEAVMRLREAPEGTYLAVFLDLSMPVMDGYETARAIRLLQRMDARKIPLIALTSDESSAARTKAKEAGMTYFLNKPVNILSVTEIIESLRSGCTGFLLKGQQDT